MLRGPEAPLLELDGLSTTPGRPHGVISIDGPNPHEIDDAIAVEPIKDLQDAYRVFVFAADTSSLYDDDEVVAHALNQVEARYRHPNTPLVAYEPFLPTDSIRDLELTQGEVRSALVVSFTIGRATPPSDVAIGFGRIETRKNFRTSDFNRKCRDREAYGRYVDASALILRHLHPDTRAGQRLGPDNYFDLLVARAKRGANVNSPFMIGSNHLAGLEVVGQELAIFRTHQRSSTIDPSIGSGVAVFGTQPAPHEGLGLEVYTRVSSGLRRLEDFVMHGLLRAYTEGRPLTDRDRTIVSDAVASLNQRIAAKVRHGTIQPSDIDHWIGTGEI